MSWLVWRRPVRLVGRPAHRSRRRGVFSVPARWVPLAVGPALMPYRNAVKCSNDSAAVAINPITTA
jgi:hypothetical protein